MIRAWLACGGFGIALFACCGILQAQAPPANSTPDSTLPPKAVCKSLNGITIAAGGIGLPTTGATVRSAKLKHDHRGEYCKVLGGIHPVDPKAQDIRFEVNLPTQWNHKAVHFGGGSFDGWLGATNGLQRTPVSIASQPGPLARGFATFGSDSGHHKHYPPFLDVLNVLNASFALNAEERRNFASDGLKKTHDVAVAIMERRYGMKPARMFFLGGSTGGREAYFVVQRWPTDYDGVLGAYAGWDQVELDLQFIRVSQAMYSKGGFLPFWKTRKLANAVLRACDAKDGLKDGIVSDPAGCRFDPAVLACKNGVKGFGCLSKAQLKTVQTFATEQRTAEPLYHGVQTIPGYSVLAGTNLTGSLGILPFALHPPSIPLNSFYYLIGDHVLKYFLTKDTHYNALHFNTITGGKYAADLLPQSKASDASDADLTPFEQHGGKLLILHGTIDATIPTNSSVLYYTMVQGQMSQPQIDSFLRLYLVPGYGHGRGVFNAGFDALGVLDHWVETGVAPKNLVVVDNHRSQRTRPLCVYPTWPKYTGAGDPNDASSFTCAAQ
jgi:hypothetical protein